jgi:hypothetical protein
MPDSTVSINIFLADDSDMVRDRVAAMLASRAMNIVGQGLPRLIFRRSCSLVSKHNAPMIDIGIVANGLSQI